MLIPNLNDFLALARDHTLVPVAKVLSSDLLTPVGAFLALAEDQEQAFLLESVEGGEKIGRYTFVGVKPYMTVQSHGEEVKIVRRGRKQRIRRNLFEALKEIFAEHKPARVPSLPPFTSGAVGYFSYDAVRQLEKLPSRAKDDLKIPDCALMFFDRLLAFDHARQEVFIIATVDTRGGNLKREYARAERDITTIERRLRSGTAKRKPKPVKSKLKVDRKTSPAKFMHDVERVKEYIRAGDVFQAVLSQRLEFEPGVPPFQIYRALRRVNPSPYMYFLKMKDATVLGSSPEMLVKCSGGALQYRPIAGTRARGRDDAHDQQLERELLADEKERAEHVMLVDLGRNDLGRVSEWGSVKVSNLMFVERYSHVMHIVSALTGKLRQGLSPIDALAACFPAGTLTGAPKVRAMQIIEELEPVRRGVYGGAVMYADFAGNLDSCIAIRTMLAKGKRAYVQAGAGLVADSIPESEHQECLNKARALLRAVEMARAGD